MNLTWTNNQTPTKDTIAKMHETINRLTAITSVVDIIILPVEKKDEIIGQMLTSIPGLHCYNGINTIFLPADEVAEEATRERWRGKAVLYMTKDDSGEWRWLEGGPLKDGVDGGAFYQCQCDNNDVCPGCKFVAYLKARIK